MAKLIDLEGLGTFFQSIKELFAEKTKIEHITATSGTYTLKPGVKYIFDNPVTELTLNLEALSSNAVAAEYRFVFTSPANAATNLTLPEGVKVPAGFEILANCRYEFSIEDELAGYLEYLLS